MATQDKDFRQEIIRLLETGDRARASTLLKSYLAKYPYDSKAAELLGRIESERFQEETLEPCETGTEETAQINATLCQVTALVRQKKYRDAIQILQAQQRKNPSENRFQELLSLVQTAEKKRLASKTRKVQQTPFQRRLGKGANVWRRRQPAFPKPKPLTDQQRNELQDSLKEDNPWTILRDLLTGK